jgi:hypothetical protein
VRQRREVGFRSRFETSLGMSGSALFLTHDADAMRTLAVTVRDDVIAWLKRHHTTRLRKGNLHPAQRDRALENDHQIDRVNQARNIGQIRSVLGRRSGRTSGYVSPDGVNTDSWRERPLRIRTHAERHGLFPIIALGEGVVGTVAALSAVVEQRGWTLDAALVALASGLRSALVGVTRCRRRRSCTRTAIEPSSGVMANS